jgi:tetratricopeptide (TPR) repeat protein
MSYRQAEDAFRLGDYERAARGYEIFLRIHEPEDIVPRAYYKLALARFRQGDSDECLRVLDRMERQLEGRKFPRVDQLRGDVEQARGNTVSALRWWEIAWMEAEGDERIEMFRHIRTGVSQLDESALASARTVLQADETRALVDARLRHGG